MHKKKTWIFAAILGFVLSEALPLTVLAWQPKEAESPKKVAPVFKRVFKFERLSEPMPRKLYAADPKLLELKYAAEIHLVMPNSKFRPDTNYLGDKKLKRLFFYKNRSLISHQMTIDVFAGEGGLGDPGGAGGNYSGSPDGPALKLPPYFQQLADNIPAERRPKKESVAALIEAEKAGNLQANYKQYLRGSASKAKPIKSNITSFVILATTAERAQQLAETLLVLLDEGLFLPAQRNITITQQGHAEEQRRLNQKFPLLQQQLKALEQKIEKMEPIGKDELGDLKTQRRLLSVGLAGVEARIGACEKILRRRSELSTNRIEQVETIKIAAEIELVGLAARQARIDRIIVAGNEFFDLSNNIMLVDKKIAQIGRDRHQQQTWANSYADQIPRFRPLPLEDGKVLIYPIKWKAGSEQ